MDAEKIVREYIDKTIHMSLATASDNKPWVCEVHFVYDGNLNLYWRSLKSRRHSQEISVNPHVAGNIIDKYGLGDAVVGLYFEGSAHLIENESEIESIFPLFEKRQNATRDIVEEAKTENGHKFYKATVTNWYVFGKFDGKGSQKYQLVWNGGNK